MGQVDKPTLLTMELAHICQHTDSASNQHKTDLMSSLLKKCNSFNISKEMTDKARPN